MHQFEEREYESIKVPEYGATDKQHAMHDLMHGIKEIIKARPKYREAHAFYDASIDEFFSDRRIAAALKKSSDAYRFKLAAVPVHTLAERVKLKGIKIDADEEEDKPDQTQPDPTKPAPPIESNDNTTKPGSGARNPHNEQPEDFGRPARAERRANQKKNDKQQAWDDISKANNLKVWGPEIHERTFEYGDGYVFVWPAPDSMAVDQSGEESTTDDDESDSGVVIVWNSPMNARKIYDTENNVKALYDIKFYCIKGWNYADLYYRDQILHYRVKNINAKGFDAKEWEPYEVIDADTGETLAPPIEENPFGELPLKHARNGLPYGQPEHLNAYGPQRAISKMLITQISTVDAHGWPTRYALTDPDSVLNENMDTPPWDDDETSGLIDAEEIRRRQPLQGKPGMLQYLNGVKTAGEWSAADPEVFTNPVELYMSLMSTLTRTPFYSFQPGGEQPSGKARQIADAPFEAKKENRQDHLTDFWTEVVTFALKIMNKEPKSVEVVWGSSDLASDLEDWQKIQAMLEAGVPFEFAMLKAGFDEETIASWAPEEMGLLEGAQVLSAIGDGITKMANGVNNGVLTARQVNELVAKLLAKYGVNLDWAEVEQATAERDAKEKEQQDVQFEQQKQLGLAKATGPGAGKVGGPAVGGSRPSGGSAKPVGKPRPGGSAGGSR